MSCIWQKGKELTGFVVRWILNDPSSTAEMKLKKGKEEQGALHHIQQPCHNIGALCSCRPLTQCACMLDTQSKSQVRLAALN